MPLRGQRPPRTPTVDRRSEPHSLPYAASAFQLVALDASGSLGSVARPGQPRAGSLAAAHRGYAYQDLVTAYLLNCCLVQRYEAVVVDRKAVDDDRFDDIEITASGRRTRRQIKSSAHADRALCFADFNANDSSLRFDRLVNTFTAQDLAQADQYRLSATWALPAASDPIAPLLLPVEVEGTFATYTTKTFRLDAARVWPEQGPPVFECLRHTQAGTRPLARDEVLRFCERFVVELALPPASLDLDVPGALERQLLSALTEPHRVSRRPVGLSQTVSA